jgi:thymidylate kinase
MSSYSRASRSSRPGVPAGPVPPASRTIGAAPAAGRTLGTMPDRAAVLAATAASMASSGRRWAWQGPVDARTRWVGETGPKDLDVWCEDGGDPATDPATALCASLTCARVIETDHPGRLRHVILAVETPQGAAVVDIDYGDLRVGPVLLVPAAEITIDVVRQRLTGVAAVADLMLRPLLRGRMPQDSRRAQARAAWAVADPADRARLIERLTAQLGSGISREISEALTNAAGEPDRRLPQRVQARLVIRSLTPTNIASTWAERNMIVPAGASAGPLGMRVRGIVVALVGTDGSGKTTVADELDERLRRIGWLTGSAYFGMGRGNLPGVNLARRLLGVAKPVTDRPLPVERTTDHRHLRRLAAWFYVGEYVWRYLRFVVPQKRGRRIVIVDRWVYDLRESPWPGSWAATVVRWLVPEPDVLVLPDAPIELIHGRKPERSLEDQRAGQQRYRVLLDQAPAAYAEVVVDTSGAVADGLADLVAVVIEAAHHPRGERRRR